jgi:dTDP-4-dehydrorhamnose 3,5-epimerase
MTLIRPLAARTPFKKTFYNVPIPVVYHAVMQVFDTSLCGVKLLRPKRFGDDRGWFAEFFNTTTFDSLNLPTQFAQDNQSKSAKGVLRGLHYQLEKSQGKLVRVLAGDIFDVAVDLRKSSPTFGKHEGFHLKPLDDENELTMLWIPEGFAHGFLVLSESADVLYKTTNLYHPPGERCIRWDDPTLNIQWPLDALGGLPPAVSAKDAKGASFLEAELP